MRARSDSRALCRAQSNHLGPRDRNGGPPRRARAEGRTVMPSTVFNRRALLRAAGFTLCVPAFLREAFADPEETGPRLLILMQPNGTHQPAFWPDPATGTSPILDPLFAN